MMNRRFESVWDALEKSPADAANMKARSEIMLAIRKSVGKWGLTQSQSAKRLGITQPRLNDLLRGRIDKFSLDALTKLAAAAELTIQWHIVRSAA